MPPRWRCRFCLHEEIHGGGRRSRLPIVKKGGKNEKEKQKKTDAAGKYTLPAAGPGWEPSLPDPEQPPQVQRLPYRPDPEQPPQVQRLPYRPDPARPPQVQLLQMQRSALPYVGRAGKNSGAANWVEKLDWKTPSGAPYTSAPEQGGPSNLSLIHISEPTRLGMISYAVFCLKKKKKNPQL